MTTEWYQCLQCKKIYEGTTHKFPTCFACNTTSHIQKVSYIFQQLLKKWEEETRIQSSSTEILVNSNFKNIIELGKSTANRLILNLILEEIHQNPSHLFHALHDLTEENPLLEEMAGRIGIQCQTWVDWGKCKGFI